MPAVKLSNPLAPAYAERLGLAVREYAIGETIVVDSALAQYLETVGYGIVTDQPAPGAPLLFGTGAPAAGLGTNGAYYLDTAAQRVYGPKTSGSGWGSGVALAGSTTLLGGMVVAPKGDKGDQGDPGTPGNAGNLALRSATDYDNTTAPTTGAVIRWDGSKYAPKVLTATDVGALALTGAQTIDGVKTFSSAPVVAAGTGAGNPIRWDDASRTNARTPTAHAASHASAGSDALTPSAIGAAASGHTHTAGSVGAASATHSHDGSAITGGQLLAIDALNLDDQASPPTTPGSGHTLWTPSGSLALNATGADNVVRRLKPIRAVTSWPADAESTIGDEAIIESTGEHRIYKGTTLGWRQASTHYLTRAQREQYTSGAHLGMVVFETDTGQEWTWLPSTGTPSPRWALTGGRVPHVSLVRTSTLSAFNANAYTVIPWDTVIVNDTGGSASMWAAANPGRIVIPVAGIYDLHFTLTWPNTAGYGQAGVARVNGGNWMRGSSGFTNSTYYLENDWASEGYVMGVNDVVEFAGVGTGLTPIANGPERSVRCSVKWTRPLP